MSAVPTQALPLHGWARVDNQPAHHESTAQAYGRDTVVKRVTVVAVCMRTLSSQRRQQNEDYFSRLVPQAKEG